MYSTYIPHSHLHSVGNAHALLFCILHLVHIQPGQCCHVLSIPFFSFLAFTNKRTKAFIFLTILHNEELVIFLNSILDLFHSKCLFWNCTYRRHLLWSPLGLISITNPKFSCYLLFPRILSTICPFILFSSHCLR